MNTFIRDCKILKPEITRLGKMLLFTNTFVLLMSWGMGNLEYYTTPILDPTTFFLIGLLIPTNVGLIGGFFIKYFREWRYEIQQAFDRLDRQDKYGFFTKRFDIN